MIFCIDFDGVICDSIKECFLSSAHALGHDPEILSDAGNVKFRKFKSLRPFVRSGEDYILIQQWLKEELDLPKEQESFDLLREQFAEELEDFKSRMYQARDELLHHSPKSWLSANPLYPGWREVLLQLISQENAHILSTKKSHYIMEILKYHQVPFPAKRIHYATATEKPEIMKEMQNIFQTKEVYLLDDQPDHLARLKDKGLFGILARWGYADSSVDFEPGWELQEALRYFTHDFPLPPVSRGNSAPHL